MIVYVESNFILEMVFVQAEHAACEDLLGLAESSAIQLIVPAQALVEPQSTVRRRRINRSNAKRAFGATLKDMSEHQGRRMLVERTRRDLDELLVLFDDEEEDRLRSLSARLLEHAHVLPMGIDTFKQAERLQSECGLEFIDALMLAAVLMDLEHTAGPSVFLNRNIRDFDSHTVLNQLRRCDCRLIGNFIKGLAFVRSRLSSAA
jgi:predicted nucleic acid-binding protein